MGRVLLICRLAARDLRHRPGPAALLLLAITAATATLALGLALNGVTSSPYLRTEMATRGPDVVATVVPTGPGQAANLAALTALARAPGVAGASGPYSVAPATLAAGGPCPPGRGWIIDRKCQTTVAGCAVWSRLDTLTASPPTTACSAPRRSPPAPATRCQAAPGGRSPTW
jgi:hypothetical protein